MGAAGLLGLPACQSADPTADLDTPIADAGEEVHDQDEAALREAENRERRAKWIERERRKRLFRMRKYYH